MEIPATSINSYIYVANNPENLADPTGRFFWVFVAIAAAIGGTINAILNYDAAKKAGLTGWSLFGATFLGFLTGAAVASLSITMPALAPVWAGLGSLVNNVGNQWIERGDLFKINWGRALLSTVTGVGTAIVLGVVFKAIPGFDRILNAEGQALVSGPFGTLAGYCVDFGFGSDKDFEIFCGVKYKPDEKIPQGSN